MIERLIRRDLGLEVVEEVGPVQRSGSRHAHPTAHELALAYSAVLIVHGCSLLFRLAGHLLQRPIHVGLPAPLIVLEGFALL
jgi:hypothetical protein